MAYRYPARTLASLVVIALLFSACPAPARGNVVAEQLFVGTWVLKSGTTVTDTFVFQRDGTGRRMRPLPWGDIDKEITWEVSDGLLRIWEPMYASKTPVEKDFSYEWGDDYKTVMITDMDTGETFRLERTTPLVPWQFWTIAPFVLATLSVLGVALIVIIRRRRKSGRHRGRARSEDTA